MTQSDRGGSTGGYRRGIMPGLTGASARAALAAMVLVTMAGAEAHATRALTFKEAIELARRGNREVQAAKARLEQSRTGIEQARAALLPVLSAQGKYTRNAFEAKLDLSASTRIEQLKNDVQAKTVDDIYTKLGQQPSADVVAAGQALADFIATQPVSTLSSGPIVIQPYDQLDLVLAAQVPIVVPWAYPTLKAARKAYEAAEGTMSSTEAQMLVATAQAFYGAAGTEELVTARDHAIEVARKTLDNARARLEVGVVNRVEVTRAELAVVRAEQAAREARDARDQAYRALGTLIQLREPFQVVTPEEPPPLPADGADQVQRRALELRPEFRSLELNRGAVKAQADAAAWRWAPTLSANGNFRAFNYQGFVNRNYAWAVGLSLDWLLYDGGQRDAARHAAVAQRRELDERLLQLRESIADELANGRQAVETKRQAVRAAERLVSLSKETLELVRVQYEAGTATQLDLLQAQDALVMAEVAVAQSRFDLGLSAVSYGRAAGTFPGTASR